jgi:uncharacterized phage protein gp47/JayE
MPYSRPTLTTLRSQAQQDIATADIPGVDGFLRFGVLPALAWTVAGQAYQHYGYQDWIAKQAVPWTASDEWLYGWGALKRVFPIDATPAGGTVTFTGTPGKDIPAGTAINRSDGLAFASTGDAIVPGGGTVSVTIQAKAPGSNGNSDTGTVFYIATPIAGVGSQGAASGPITGGSDQETQDAFRTRMLQIWASPPQGGDVTDYIEWARAVPGVTRAWSAPNGMGAGTVIVYFMMDVSEAVHGGFPQGTNGVATDETRDTAATGDQLAVANAIYPLRPATALVYACAPAAQAVNYSIANLSPNTAPIHAAITAAITAMHAAKASPGGTLYPSDWEAAIQSAPGVQHFTVGAPLAPITAPAGTLLTPGTFTYSG